MDLARRFESEAGRLGVKALTETSTAAATDADALARLRQRGAKVIYLPPAASAARYAPLVLEAGRQMQVRVVSGLPEGDHKGAVLWVALDYHKLGEDIGDLARRVLDGEKPQDHPHCGTDAASGGSGRDPGPEMERLSAGKIKRGKRGKGEEGKRDKNFSFSPFNLFAFSPNHSSQVSIL